MTERRECLNCANWQPQPHPGWKPYDWDPFYEYDIEILRGHLGPYVDWNAGWPGTCRLDPEPVKSLSRYRCGHWVVDERFLLTWRELRMTELAHQEAAEMRQKLKASQALSRARLERLKQLRTKTTKPRRGANAEDRVNNTTN